MLTLLLLTISGPIILEAIITIVIAGLIFWLLLWFIGWAGIPEPFNKVAKIVVGLAALIFLINALLMLIGKPLFTW